MDDRGRILAACAASALLTSSLIVLFSLPAAPLPRVAPPMEVTLQADLSDAAAGAAASSVTALSAKVQSAARPAAAVPAEPAEPKKNIVAPAREPVEDAAEAMERERRPSSAPPGETSSAMRGPGDLRPPLHWPPPYRARRRGRGCGRESRKRRSPRERSGRRGPRHGLRRPCRRGDRGAQDLPRGGSSPRRRRRGPLEAPRIFGRPARGGAARRQLGLEPPGPRRPRPRLLGLPPRQPRPTRAGIRARGQVFARGPIGREDPVSRACP